MLNLATVAAGCGSPTATVGDCEGDASDCWQHLGLPDRYVEDLAATPWGLFAGTDAGVYRFDSVSATWTASGLEAHIVAALAYVPRNGGYLLAGVVPANVEITAASVFASMDTGLTWVPWDNDWSDSADGRWWAYSLSVDPLDPSHILWGGAAHIGESTDGGATWDIVEGTVGGIAQGIHALVFPPGSGTSTLGRRQQRIRRRICQAKW